MTADIEKRLQEIRERLKHARVNDPLILAIYDVPWLLELVQQLQSRIYDLECPTCQAAELDTGADK